MEQDCNKHNSADPAVEKVEFFIAFPNEQAHKIVLCSQSKLNRELGQRDPARALGVGDGVRVQKDADADQHSISDHDDQLRSAETQESR